jgi:hypothetical protein
MIIKLSYYTICFYTRTMEKYVLKVVIMKYVYYTVHFHTMNHEKETFKSCDLEILYYENYNAKFLTYENKMGKMYSYIVSFNQTFLIYCFIQSNISHILFHSIKHFSYIVSFNQTFLIYYFIQSNISSH